MSTTLRLPTAAAFVALPINKRAILFANWLASQPPEQSYDYSNNRHCCMAQFGTAILGESAYAGVCGFMSQEEEQRAYVMSVLVADSNVNVLPDEPGYMNTLGDFKHPRDTGPRTFGQAARELKAYLVANPIS